MPTPNAGPQNDSDANWEARRAECKERHQNGNGFGMTLGMAASLSAVPTPRTVTGGAESAERKQELGRTDSGGGDLQAVVLLASVPTPMAHEARLASTATPSARDWKDTPGMAETGTNPDGSTRTRLDQLPRQAQLAASGETATGGGDAMASGARLNPAYSRWLMGYPPEWDQTAPFKKRRGSVG